MKTIKFYVAVLAVLVSTNLVNAQSLDMGIKAGVNFGTLRTGLDAVSEKSGKAGMHVGLFVRTGSDFFFQPELNFSTFGSEYTYNSETYESKFRQLNLPAMVGYKIVNKDNLNFRVSLGPDLNFNLKKPDAPAGTEFKRFNVGGVLNAGIDVGRFTFDARYSLGLGKMNKELEQRPGVFALSVGFKFL
ncbi:porin family protein [Parapedobacter tibetensis]|uniref:porin family protein n=1 Tax=Parapedobacter tibetensis TaxID=2972951 RepID=UPI00214DD23C|nr:porin family protein [Parapedobacter tibetensis]